MAVINGTSVGGMTLQIDYSYTQNTTANTTTVTAKIQLVGHYALYATALSGSYISVGGSKSNYGTSISYGGSGTTTTVLATKTVTVSHNNNGTASCNLSGAFVMNGTYRGYSVGTMTVNATINLPTIPRASGLTVPTSVNTGATLSGTISPSSSSFNHKVELKIGSTVKQTITLATGTNSFSATIPHSWVPNSTSATISVVLSTYSGNTFVASASKNVTVNVPQSVVPSVSAFTAVSSVTSGTFANLFVQGKTTAKFTTTASAGDGARIVSYTYTGPSVNSTSTSNTYTTQIIQTSGTLTYTVSVKDSRGRTASRNVQISVHAYSLPAMGAVSVSRCDANGNLTESGTYARYTVNSTYSNVGGKNTRTVTVAYSSNNGSTYSSATTLQAATDTAGSKTGTYGGGAFALANTYLLKFTITDAYGATSFTTKPLLSAHRPINIRSNGKGVAIGGMSTKDAFEVSMPTDFNSTVNIDGKLTLAGGLSAPLSIANGGTGVSTASSLARTHIHNDIAGASSSGGTLGCLRIARIQITAGYVNQPIEIKFSRRLDSRPTTVSLVFHNSAGLDPGYAAFVVDGPAQTWLYKSATSIWDIYVQKAESYDYIGILDAKYTDNLLEKLTITFTDVFEASVPSGAIAATKLYDDYIISQGTSGAWTYRKWSTGVAECWGTLNGTLSPYTSINGFSAYEGGVSFPANLFVSTPNVQFQPYIGNGFAIPARGVISTSTQCKWVALSNVSAANTTVKVDVFAIGRWK